jgi:hypothetical protein
MWKTFISQHILHQHWYTCSIGLPMCQNLQHRSLFDCCFSHFRNSYQEWKPYWRDASSSQQKRRRRIWQWHVRRPHEKACTIASSSAAAARRNVSQQKGTIMEALCCKTYHDWTDLTRWWQKKEYVYFALTSKRSWELIGFMVRKHQNFLRHCTHN